MNYDILSPDGIAIHFEDTYKTKISAFKAFINWKRRYITQGYYSSAKYGQIHLDDLKDYCQLIEIKNR